MSSAKRAGPIRLISTLGMAGLFSGLLLVTVYLATKPIIERNQAEALEAAIYRVVPGSSDRRAFVVRDGTLAPIELQAAAGASENILYGAFGAQGELIGYAIPGKGPGFQDTISLIYGYDPSRKQIVGMEVLESRETPGLGDKIIKDEHFLANFRELQVKPEILLVKPGAKTAPNEVDSISGATISSKAVVNILKQSNERFLSAIEGTTQEQPQ